MRRRHLNRGSMVRNVDGLFGGVTTKRRFSEHGSYFVTRLGLTTGRRRRVGVGRRCGSLHTDGRITPQADAELGRINDQQRRLVLGVFARLAVDERPKVVPIKLSH